MPPPKKKNFSPSCSVSPEIKFLETDRPQHSSTPYRKVCFLLMKFATSLLTSLTGDNNIMLRLSFVDNSIDGFCVPKIYYDKAETVIYLIAWKICKVMIVSCVGVGKGVGHFCSFIQTGLDVVVVSLV